MEKPWIYASHLVREGDAEISRELYETLSRLLEARDFRSLYDLS